MDTKLSVLISSCDKFSDLWDAHMELYRKNWQAQPCKTYLVTDKPTDRHFDGVEIIVAEENMDFPMRINYALQYIDTPYVLVTLDDYFLIDTVEARNITVLENLAEENQIDYLLLYDRRKTNPKRYTALDMLQPIDLTKKYALTLYPAIWSVDFLRKTVKEDLSPWLYEASLTKTAIAENAKCQFSHTGTFCMLDVIRKGKVLHKAHRYFRRHRIDIGDRPIISRWVEIKLAIMDVISWYTPRKLFMLIKKIARKCGARFYSED